MSAFDEEPKSDETMKMIAEPNSHEEYNAAEEPISDDRCPNAFAVTTHSNVISLHSCQP